MSTKDILTPENVNGIFRDCLFRDGEDTTDHVRADGVTFSVGFHPERLDGHRQEIEAMLSELPDSFKEGVDGGGGYSFLDACMNRHGNLWTGLHKTVEELILLGVAIGKVEFTLPREIWRALPGGMPYLSVKQ